MIMETVQQLRIGGKVAIADIEMMLTLSQDDNGYISLEEIGVGDATITRASIGCTDAPLASVLWGVAQAYLDSPAGCMAAHDLAAEISADRKSIRDELAYERGRAYLNEIRCDDAA